MGRQPWNDLELDILRRALDKGYDIPTIQNMLPHRSYDAVEKAAKRRGWKRAYPDPQIDHDMVACLLGDECIDV
jgi:hypothetical protein